MSDWGRRKGRQVIDRSRKPRRRTYQARLMSACGRCGDVIEVGDYITYWGRGVAHTGCTRAQA